MTDEALKEAFASWATGVTVVTVRDEAGVHGLTASAFTPVSLDPPLVLVCVGNDAPILTHVLDARRFTVNLLSEDQRRTANVYSDRFTVNPPPFEAGDDAILEDSLASIVCTLESDIEAGDHRIMIGRVRSLRSTSAGRPLIRYARRYDTLK